MSLQQAITYIRLFRKQDPAGEKKRGSSLHYDLQQLCTLAESKGLTFTTDELRKAHSLDWKMRAAMLLDDRV